MTDAERYGVDVGADNWLAPGYIGPCTEGDDCSIVSAHTTHNYYATDSGAVPDDGVFTDAYLWTHRRGDGELCRCRITFPPHSLESTDPLHIERSLLCPSCGAHGFVRDGCWTPA